MAISEARQRANAKYNKKAYDRLEMKVPKGKKAEILSHAEKQGESLNKFLNRAVENQIAIDNNPDLTKVIPQATADSDELNAIEDTKNETELISHNDIDWD